MSNLTVQFCTHEPEGESGIKTQVHQVTLPRFHAVDLCRFLYGRCEPSRSAEGGYFSVAEETLTALTPEESDYVTGDAARP